MPKFPCPCCQRRTLEDAPPGTSEICPVCFWEDDRAQHDDPTLAGGANDVSLTEARTSYAAIGAIEPRFIEYVRPPEAGE